MIWEKLFEDKYKYKIERVLPILFKVELEN